MSQNETPKLLPKQKRTFRLVSKRIPGLYQDSLTQAYYGRVCRDGKHYKTKLQASDESRAKLEFEGWKIELRKIRTDGKAQGNSGRTFGDFAAQALVAEENRTDVKEKSKTYVRERWAGLKKDWPELESIPIADLTPEVLGRWAAIFAQSHHGHTYNRTLAFVRDVCQRAIDCGKIFRNPASELKRVGVAPVARDVPSIGDFKAILVQMRARKFGTCQRSADLAALLCYTGSRLSEGLAMQWKHVDWNAREVTIIRIKNRKRSNEPAKVVKFPFWSELESLLKALKEKVSDAKPEDRLARVQECRGTMQRAVKELQEAKTLPMGLHLHHHSLRHTWASWAIASGMDIKTVAYLLGHSDGGALLLKTYAHLLPGQASTAIKKLDALC